MFESGETSPNPSFVRRGINPPPFASGSIPVLPLTKGGVRGGREQVDMKNPSRESRGLGLT